MGTAIHPGWLHGRASGPARHTPRPTPARPDVRSCPRCGEPTVLCVIAPDYGTRSCSAECGWPEEEFDDPLAAVAAFCRT